MDTICAECHRLGNGCCSLTDTEGKFQIGIFAEDIYRIEMHTSFRRNYFVVKDKVTDEILDFLSNTNYSLFNNIFYNNNRLKLQTINGNCIFLKENGCCLSTNVRPLYCRVYPFWPSKNYQNIYILSSNDCLAQEESTLDWTIVNKHFRYSEEYLYGLFEEMKKCSNDIDILV